MRPLKIATRKSPLALWYRSSAALDRSLRIIAETTSGTSADTSCGGAGLRAIWLWMSSTGSVDRKGNTPVAIS